MNILRLFIKNRVKHYVENSVNKLLEDIKKIFKIIC